MDYFLDIINSESSQNIKKLSLTFRKILSPDVVRIYINWFLRKLKSLWWIKTLSNRKYVIFHRDIKYHNFVLEHYWIFNEINFKSEEDLCKQYFLVYFWEVFPLVSGGSPKVFNYTKALMEVIITSILS